MVGLYTVTLQNVGIDGSLCKEFNPIEFAGFFCKHINKLFADDLALLFRIADTCQLIQKAVNRIHIDQIGTELILKYLYNLFRLTLAEQPVVDVYAGELIAYCFDQQCSNNGRVNAAGECKKHFLFTD